MFISVDLFAAAYYLTSQTALSKICKLWFKIFQCGIVQECLLWDYNIPDTLEILNSVAVL